jgi:hypothetical protein
MKGKVSDENIVDFRFQDVIEGKEKGHVYHTLPILLTSELQTFEFQPSDFKKYTYYGEQTGELDWSKIKNLQFQVSKKPAEYYPYEDSYDDKGLGSLIKLDIPNAIAWEGNRCFVDFSYTQLLDLTDLKEIRIKTKGQGNVDFHIIKGIESDPNASVFAYQREIALTSDYVTHTFPKDEFNIMLYTANSRTLDWSKIRKVQFQVSTTDNAHVEVEFVEMELNNGKIYRIDNIKDITLTSVAVESIQIILKDGQAQANNCYHVYANAHGSSYINTSYFMPAHYRAFKEIDPEGTEVWQGLIDKTYQD